jgi:hypothetical protein
MTEPAIPPVALPSGRKIAIGSAVAIAVASAALVFFVLPAELGVDPTGFGKATGLTGLAGTGGEQENIYLKRGQARTNTLFPLAATAVPDEATLRKTLADKGIALPADGKVRSDRFEFELLPYEGIELKYDLVQGAPVIFAWKASVPVYLDMHSHPFKGGTDLTESFVIGDLPSQTGVYVAPFTGIHGWYWQNRTLDNVTLTLDATGLMTASRIFNQAGEHPRPLSDEPAGTSDERAAPAP